MNRTNRTDRFDSFRTLERLACLAEGAAAEEGGDAVEAGGAERTGSGGAVVDVLRAVGTAPAVHAHAGVAAGHVAARTAVLTGVGLQATLVHVVRAELT